MSKDRYALGMQTRRSVLGDAHVDGKEAEKTEFDADFQHYITENIWGDIWRRGGLDTRDRSMITIAMLAALGHYEELAMHIRATRNTGVSEDEVREILMQVSVYAGVPVGNTAIRVAKAVYAENAKTGK